MKWESAKLGDLYEVHNGISKGRKFFGSGYPFLSFSTIFNNYFIPDELTDFIQSTDTERKSYSIKRGDVFVTRTSETSNELGMSCVALKDYPNATYNGFTKRLRPTTDRVLPEFVGYYMRTPHFRGKFLAFSTMTTRASLRNEDLLGLTIPIPPLPTQTRIASILSAYDDLIENNRKQIKLLEEAAQRLYKEWFVDFKFPGHENVKIVDGVLEGWERKTLAQCLKMYINGGWGKEQPNGKNLYKGRVIRGTDIKDVKMGNFLDVPLRYHTENDIKKRKLNINDIVFELSNGNIDNLGRCLFVDSFIEKELGENSICASFCKLLRPINKLHSIIIYWEIQYMHSSKRIVPFRKNGSNGINNFAFDKFLSHSFLMPTNYEFIKPFEDIMSKIENIREQLMLLKEARDRLLPKLMSGEIEV